MLYSIVILAKTLSAAKFHTQNQEVCISKFTSVLEIEDNVTEEIYNHQVDEESESSVDPIPLENCISITSKNEVYISKHHSGVFQYTDGVRKIQIIDKKVHGVLDPRDVYVTKSLKSQMIFIADSLGNKVVGFNLIGAEADVGNPIVFKSGVEKSSIDSISEPLSVIMDEENSILFIADSGNNRVLRWKIGSNAAEVVPVFHEKNPISLAFSQSTRDLYVGCIGSMYRWNEDSKTSFTISDSLSSCSQAASETGVYFTNCKPYHQTRSVYKYTVLDKTFSEIFNFDKYDEINNIKSQTCTQEIFDECFGWQVDSIDIFENTLFISISTNQLHEDDIQWGGYKGHVISIDISKYEQVNSPLEKPVSSNLKTINNSLTSKIVVPPQAVVPAFGISPLGSATAFTPDFSTRSFLSGLFLGLSFSLIFVICFFVYRRLKNQRKNHNKHFGTDNIDELFSPNFFPKPVDLEDVETNDKSEQFDHERSAVN